MMMNPAISAVLVSGLLASPTLAASYKVVDSFTGNAFLDANNFNFITEDPSGGYVNYMNKATAQSEGLVSVSGSTFKLGVEHTKTVSSSASGRDSVRIESVKYYGHHVSIYNVAHMPTGCGTWPALWEVGHDWEADGEIDILEGVNDQAPNYATLHVGPNSGSTCTMPASRNMTGFAENNDCDHRTSDSGCSVGFVEKGNYGPDFNANGGGFYAMEQTANFVKIWFWPRSLNKIPADVLAGGSAVSTDGWGEPSAFFPNTDCDINAHFTTRNIIINVDLCGSWAADAFNDAGCPGTCTDYVKNNPSAFANAYFTLNWIKVYQ